jgi:hypothetical protein
LLAPRLLISREGEPDASVVLAGGRVVGSIRGTPVSLTLETARITGKLGERNVWLWLHGHQAQGDIGGVPVRFELMELPDGYLLREGYSVRKELPPQATRLTLTASTLTWSPCGAALAQVAPGTFEGSCTSSRRARVVLPPGWRGLPALTEAILLSFFLTERDPSFAGLFGTSR